MKDINRNKSSNIEMKRKVLEKSNENFYLRIRTDESEKDRDGIVYYNGFNPFSIKEDGNINLLLKEFLEINSKNIKRTKKELEKIHAKRKVMYDKFELSEIYFEKGNVCSSDQYTEETKNDGDKKYETILKTIEEDEEIKDAIEVNRVDRKIKIKMPSLNVEYKILDYLYNKSKISAKDIRNKKRRYSVFGVKRKYSMKPKNNIGLEEICEEAKELVKIYEDYTKIEKEKKYQHFFLINSFNKQDYKNMFSENVLPFECEYYIDEIKQDGRIDVIFYSHKDKKVTDLYLIELKVDTKVLGGSNGIHKHLLDIKNINKLKSNFYSVLEERIKDRHQFIYNEDLVFDKNYNKYFYIIIGQCKKTTEEIIGSLKTLNNIKNDKLEIKVELKKVDYEEYNNKPVKDILKEMDGNIKVQLFIDENKWNEKEDLFNPEYQNYTYLLEGKNKDE